MSGYADYNNRLLKIYPDRHRVPLILATEENFSEYGHFVKDYHKDKVIIKQWPTNGWRQVMGETGLGGGIAEGKFEYKWEGNKLYAQNYAVGGVYTTGILPLSIENSDECKRGNKRGNKRKYVLTREANYHPDGGQIFYPIKLRNVPPKPFILLLALPGDDIKLEDFVAFYFDGTLGVQILPNIWHQPVYPIDNTAMFMTKQGKVHACIGMDSIREFEKWIEIPLEFPPENN